jgi:hypothetical protein
VKPGSLLCVSTLDAPEPPEGILLAAWAREDVPVGSALIPYLWNVNFYASGASSGGGGGGSKHEKFVCVNTAVSSFLIQPCAGLLLSLSQEMNSGLTSEQMESLARNRSFLEYVVSLLQCVYVSSALTFSCTWYGTMLKVSVARAVGATHCLVGAAQSQQFQVGARTVIEFDGGSGQFSDPKLNMAPGGASVSFVPPLPLPLPLLNNAPGAHPTAATLSAESKESKASFHGFAGYPEVVADALKCISFSLPPAGVRQTAVTSSGSGSGSGSTQKRLLRAPKGLLIHGASGVGKTKLVQAIVRCVSESAGATAAGPSYTVVYVPSTLLLSK